ncbi:MAG TPA: hypothetical protein VHC69_06750 [Polyangiaceae bacterium]|nr:hypothetical protein [Polyangiaceae bacterium]
MSFTFVQKSLFAGWVQRSVGVAGVALALHVAAGCTSDNPPTSLNQRCKLNSDCTGNLVCSFGFCHAECEKAKDCPANQLCVTVGGQDSAVPTTVCQLQEESHCAHNSECNAPLVCAVDLQCRNQCLETRDCISGEVCVFGVCANPEEIASSGKLKGAIAGSTAPGSGAGGTRNDGGLSNGGGSGGSGQGGASGASPGGAGGSGTSRTDAGTGGSEIDASPGTDGGDSGTVASSGDSCGTAEKTPNDDRDHATAYELGTNFRGCLQTNTDVDFYSYTVPSSPAQGGVVVVSLTEVGTTGGLDVTTQAVADDGDVVNAYGTAGQSVFQWFNAKAGASFRVKVSYFTGSQTATPYTLQVKYSGVNDKNEPNDSRAMATPITNGVAVQGYLFAGFENSTSIADGAWDDWFKITFPAGMAAINLTDIASDITGDLTLYDSLGSQVTNDYSVTNGASVVMNQMVAAGDYYVKVTPFLQPAAKGTGSTVPAYVTQPYTLTATVK